MQALEAVREQLFLRLYKELPYAARLRLASCRPLPDGSGGRAQRCWRRALRTLCPSVGCVQGSQLLVLEHQQERLCLPSFPRPSTHPPALSHPSFWTAAAAVRIDVDILVAAESTKRIVIGAGGAQVAAISRAARSELEAAWGHPVHLSLRVQVDK